MASNNTRIDTRKWKPEHVQSLIIGKTELQTAPTRILLEAMNLQLQNVLFVFFVRVIYHPDAVTMTKVEEGEFFYMVIYGWSISLLLNVYRLAAQRQKEATRRKKREIIANNVAAAVEVATAADCDSFAAWKALTLLAQLAEAETKRHNNNCASKIFEINYRSAERAVRSITDSHTIRQPPTPYDDDDRFRITQDYKRVSSSWFGVKFAAVCSLTIYGCVTVFKKFNDRYAWIFYLPLVLSCNYEILTTWRQERDVELLVDELYHIAIAELALLCDTAVVCTVVRPTTNGDFCEEVDNDNCAKAIIV